MDATELAQVILDEVQYIRDREHWNHDHIENKVTEGVCSALESIAQRLRNP